MENNRNRIGSLALAALLLMAFTPSSYWNDPWPVPEKFQKMPNPVKADAESLDRKSTRLNSSHTDISRMPSSA